MIVAPMSEDADAARPTVPFWVAFRYWLKLGCVNFGGPTGQIALMHHDLVEQRRWIGEQRFLHALNYCMLLPGPEATQLAVYVGWLLHRTLGGLVAGILFVLPGAVLMLALSYTYAEYGNVAAIAAIFYGVRAAVLAIVAAAVLRIGSKSLKNGAMVAVAGVAFVAIFLFRAPFPLIVVGAGLLGLVGSRAWPRLFVAASGHGGGTAKSDVVLHDDEPPPPHARPSWWKLARCVAIGLVAWFGPLLLVAWWRGRDDVLTHEATFFSKCAMVTFGGAYAVLEYIRQAAVHFGWMEPKQMLDGLGLAESTPGPLILVTQFVGFLGAHRTASGGAIGLAPTTAGVVGTLVTLWATFAPCFLWIFAGAPYLEQSRGAKSLSAALATITASVVGVVLNLSVALGLQALFTDLREWRGLGMVVPVPHLSSVHSVDGFVLVVGLVAFVGMRRWKWGIVPVVVASAALGLAWKLLVVGPAA
jgi:chromate transporter